MDDEARASEPALYHVAGGYFGGEVKQTRLPELPTPLLLLLQQHCSFGRKQVALRRV